MLQISVEQPEVRQSCTRAAHYAADYFINRSEHLNGSDCKCRSVPMR